LRRHHPHPRHGHAAGVRTLPAAHDLRSRLEPRTFAFTGSYRVVWLISIALGIFAALVNLPIEERAIERDPAPRAA